MRPTQWYLKDLLKRGEMTMESFVSNMKRYYDIDIDADKTSVLVKERYFRTKVNIVEMMVLPKNLKLVNL